MGLTINQSYAKIGMETTPGSFNIHTARAKLDFQSKLANLNIHTELPRISIDQTDAFASEGLKSSAGMIKEAAQDGYQNLMDYIAKSAADGKTYAAIEYHSDAIAQISRRDTYQDHEFGIALMPSVRPNITVTEGTQTFSPDPINGEGMRNGVSGSYQAGSIEFNYAPAHVKIFLQQYASINMNYQPDHLFDVRS